MRTLFFPLLIIVCAFSLFFRLNTLFAQTTETPAPNPELIVLTQKVAAEQTTSPLEQNIVFELSESEQSALTHLENVENARYLATLYGQMRPKAAARILTQLTDEQIVLILNQMLTTQSAAVLSHIDAKRAGTISLQLVNPHISE